MKTTIEAMKQALAVLDATTHQGQQHSIAKRSLRAAIAREEAGTGEPDAIGCKCSACGEWQRSTASGMVCKNGHGGVGGLNVALFTRPAPAPTGKLELNAIHAVVMDIGGDWPEVASDPYTLHHVKRMARELKVAGPAPTGERAALIAELTAACNGHPNALIPWPHRLLHRAIDMLAADAPPVNEGNRAQPIAEKWAIYFAGYPENHEYKPAFMGDWSLFNSEATAECECSIYNRRYSNQDNATRGYLPYHPKRVFIYAADAQQVAVPQGPCDTCKHGMRDGVGMARECRGCDEFDKFAPQPPQGASK